MSSWPTRRELGALVKRLASRSAALYDSFAFETVSWTRSPVLVLLFSLVLADILLLREHLGPEPHLKLLWTVVRLGRWEKFRLFCSSASFSFP